MPKGNFKTQFKDLMNQMETLVDSANADDLAAIKAELVHVPSIKVQDSIICISESDFDLKMMYKISGVEGDVPYILLDHHELSNDAINHHYKVAKDQDKLFILPSVVSSHNDLTPTLETPYLLFFTRDNKLFMYPEDGTAFFDTEEMN